MAASLKRFGFAMGVVGRFPASSRIRIYVFNFAAILALVLSFSARTTSAATRTWDNGGADNMWSTAANWSGDVAPTSSDDVVFNGTSVANCYFDQYAPTILSLTFTGAYTGKFQWGYAQFGRGMRGQYYADNAYTGGTYSRIDATVNFASDWNGGAEPASGISADQFRVVWTGYILPQYAQTYTFYEQSDDGGKLWVDGNLIIDQFVDNTAENSAVMGYAFAAATLYKIRYEYYENAGAAGALLSWSSSSQAKQIIPQNRLFPDHNGLKQQWWSNTDETGTTGTDAAPFVDFNWGGAGPDEYFTNDDFSGEWQGYIVPLYTETYTFYSYKDDGVYLWVNDVQIINSWSCGCGTATSSTIDLIAGVPYWIDMQFRDTGGNGYVNLQWSSASQAQQVVPHDQLFVPYILHVTGNVDLRTGGEFNMGAGELQFNGTGAQTFIPPASGTLARVVQNGSGTTTISTNNLTVKSLEVQAGTLNLGTGRTITPDYFKITGGTVNFNTSTLALNQKTVSFSSLGSATSAAAGSKITFGGTPATTTITGTITGTDLDIDFNGAGDYTVSGVLALGTGIVTKGGSGDVTLSGNNTWSGGYTHSGSGDTYLSHNNALGTGTATMSGSGKFRPQNGITTPNALTINNCNPGSGLGVIYGPTTAGQVATWSGAITINANCSSGGHFQGGNATGGLTLSGTITSASYNPVMRSNKIILTGVGSYPTLSVAGGTTYLGAANIVPVTAGLDIAGSATATLDLNGYNVTFTDVTRTGGNTALVTNSSGTAATFTLNFTAAGADSTITPFTGNLNFTKTGSGSFKLAGSSTYTGVTTVSAGTLTISSGGAITSTQSFIVTSGASVDIYGDLTLSSDATGVFGVGYGVASGTSTVTLYTGGTMSIGNGGGRTFVGGGPSGGPYGTGVLTLAGGTCTVAAAGAFPNDKVFVAGYGGTGTINLNGGTLFSSRQITEGSGTTSFYFNGGTFKAGISGWWFPGFDTFQVRDGGAIFDPNGLDVGVDDDLIHSTQGGDNATDGGVTVTGSSAGRLFLRRTAAAWTGPTTVNAGVTLLLDATGVIPDASPVTVNGTLDLSDYSETIGSLAGSGIVDNLSGGAGTFTLTTGGNNTNTSFTGLIKNTAGTVALVKAGTGQQILTGNNTYTGGTTINAGWIRDEHNNGFGTGTVTVNAGGFAMLWSPSGLTIPNNWVLNGSSGDASYPTLTHDGGGGAVVLNGTISVTAASEIGMGGTTSNTMQLNGVISGSGNITIDEANGGSSNTLIFNATNTFSGTLTVLPGVLRLAAANSIPDGVAVTDNATTGGIDMYGHSETIGSLAGTGIWDSNNGAGTFTLTTGGDNTSTSYSGIIKNTAGTVAVTKAGTGTWTVSGAGTYTGATTVSAGTLKLAHATAAMGTSAGGCVVSSGAALDLNGQTYSTAEACTISGTGVSSGGAIMNSSSTAASYAGLLTLGAAASIIAGTGNITIGNAGTITGATYNLTLGGAANGTMTSIIGTTSGKVVKQDAGTWTLSAANTYTGGTDFGGGTISTAAENNLGVPSGAIIANFTGYGTLLVTSSWSTTKELVANGTSRSMTVNVASGQTLTNTGALRNYNASNYVVKLGTGTWIQAGDGSYVDLDIDIQAGTMEFRQANGMGDNGADGVHLAAGTTMRLVSDAGVSFVGGFYAYGTGANVVVDRVTSGAAVTHSMQFLSYDGAYTLNVSAGANITSGTAGLTVRGTTTLGGNAVLDVTDPGTPDLLTTLTGNVGGNTFNLTVQGTGNTTIAGVVGTTSGTMTKAGTGTLLLSGNNTYTGATTVSAGTLKTGHANALGTTAAGTTVSSGATLDLNGTALGAEAVSITGTGVGANGAIYNSGASASASGDFTITANPCYVGGSGDITLSGATTTNTITKIGANTLTLTGTTDNNSFSLIANAGTVVLAKTSSGTVHAVGGVGVTIGGGTVKLGGTGGDQIYNGQGVALNTGTFDMNAVSETIAALTGAGGTFDNTSGAGTYTLTLTGTSTYSSAATFQNTSGTLAITINGSGSVHTWTGTNTYSGATTISAGTLKLGSATALGAVGGSTTVASGAVLDLNGQTYTNAEPVTISGTGISSGGALINSSGTGSAFPGLITLGASASIIAGSGGIYLSHVGTITGSGFGLTLGGAAAGSTLASIIGTGAGTVTKQDAGDWTLYGASTYTGATTVSAGTLKLGGDAALGTAAGATSVTSGAVLDLNGVTYSTAEPLTINGTGISSGGAIKNGNASAATFAGLITLGAASSIIAGSGDINLTNTGTITGAGFDLTLGGAANGTLASIVGTTTGAITKSNNGIWTLSGANTYSGSTAVVGTLRITNASALGTGSVWLNSGNLEALLDGSGSNGTITVNNQIQMVSGQTSGLKVANNGSANTGNTIQFASATWGNSTLNVTGANGYKLSLPSLSMNGGAGTTVINATTADVTVGTIASNGNGAHILQLDGTSTACAVTGAITVPVSALSLTKAGAGTWTLGGTNTYTGTTTLNAGQLTVNGSLNSGSAVTVNSSATLAGTGSLPGTLTVAAGGIVAPGDGNETTISAGATVMNNTSVWTYTLGTVNTDKIAVTGNFTLDGTLNVSAGTGFTYGIYTLATYTGTLTNNTLNLGTMPYGYFGTITAGSGVVTLNVLDYTGFAYVSTVNFNTTSTGANVANNVTNFPMLIRLDSNNFGFEQAMPDGRDMRFADPDGTALQYEIERWDATLKRAEIWVLVPQVDGNSDRDFINMYWGNSTATALTSPTKVFQSSNNFAGVWHLAENGNTTAGGYADATGSYALTGAGAISSSSDVEGLAGLGSTFNGSSDRIEADLQLITAYPFTLSTWMKITVTNGWNSMVWIGDKDASDMYYNLNATPLAKARARITGTDVTADGTVSLNDGTWHLVSGVYASATDRKIYVDGALAGSSTTNVTFNSAIDRVSFGRTARSAPADYFLGTLDEPEISTAARSADWIKLSYETQRKNPSAVTYPNSQLSKWGYSNKVFVNTSATGANVPGDVANFPMLVRLTSANFNFSQARSDGADLRFADSTGTLLSYELSHWDLTNKKAEAWVLLPTIRGNNNSQWFRMYWGKANATSLSSGSAVFQTSNSYAAEYHMEESSGSVTDATTNGNNGTFNGNVPNLQTANIGKGHLFDGNGDYTGAASNSSFDFSSADRVTLSAWVNRSGAGVTGDVEGIAAKYKWYGSSDRNFGLWHNPGTGFTFAVNTDGGPSSETSAFVGAPATNGTWYHVAGVADGSKARIFVNGIEKGNIAFSGNIFYSAGGSFKIGEVDDDGGSYRQYFNGYIDEVGVASVARSADWIKLSYESQKAATTTVSVGARSADYAYSTRFTFNTTGTNGPSISSNVTNIPILVRLSSANINFANVRDDAADLQFVDKDGSYLYHEVVEWDKGNQTGKVWVKVPQVDGNSNADFITLYYGCGTCTAAAYAAKDSVWRDYKSVFHLNAPEALAYDAASLGNNGAYTSGQPSVPGLTTKNAAFFDGTTNYIDVPNQANYGITTNLSVSAWIKVAAFTKAWQSVATKGDGSTAGFRLHREGSNNNMRFGCGGLATNIAISATTSVNDDIWHMVTGTYDGANLRIYTDGVSEGGALAATGSIVTNTDNLNIGENAAGTGRQWYGAISEVRIGNTTGPLAADYIKLSYENQKAASTLFSAATLTTASFQKSKVFPLNTTASGANVAGDVYNFPLLLRISGNAPGTATAITDLTQSAGQDIRFLADDGVTWLDYQLERWDPSVDSAEVWVKVPRIRGNSSNGFITMYYQQASGITVPDGQCGSCVFGSNNGFVGVWHMNTAGTTARPNVVAGGNAATTNSYDNDELKGGAIFTADSLDGTNDYLSLGTGYADFTSGITLSIWANLSSSANWSRLFDMGNGSASDNILLTRYGSTAHMHFEMFNGAGSVGVDRQDNVIVNNTWQFWTATFSPRDMNMYLYLNGSLIKTVGVTSFYKNISRANCYIGKSNWGADAYMQGKVDEPEIANVTRDSNWIKLSYQNQRNDAAPLFNPSPGDFQKTKKFAFNTTNTGAGVMDSVTNFPVLVRINGSVGGTPITDLVQGSGTASPPDIRFLDGDGKTWLNYQVERWDRNNSVDSGEVWVLVPKVDGNSDHDFITMYYQQATGVTISANECGYCVFSPTNGYAAEYHLNAEFADQTGNGNTLTDVSSTAGIGDAAAGRGLNGSNQEITAANATSLNMTAAVTVSAWINATSWASGNRRIVQKGPDQQYGILEESGVLRWKLSGPSVGNLDYATLPTTGAWHHVGATYDGATSAIYIDGVAVASQAATGALSTATNVLSIGNKPGSGVAGDHFNGIIDEVNVANTARSANWLKLAYESQRRTGNLFWNARTGPNNIAALTATAGSRTIALSWPSAVSDSSNADSVGIWVKYTGYPDSANATGVTRVVTLAKTDTTYNYPAVAAGLYYFGLAVRNTSGVWSPMTKAGSDTANLQGYSYYPDTVYVDSAAGLDANSCTLAQSPFTPKKTLTSALACSATDTLVIRAMPGIYTDSFFTISSKPSIVSSFDLNSRAILNGSTTQNDGGSNRSATVMLTTDMILRNMDVKAAVNDYIGVYLFSTGTRSRVEGCRIYNNGSIKHHEGITWLGNNDQTTIANNLIYQPLQAGIYVGVDNSFNILHNVLIGNGTSTYAAINHTFNTGWTDMTVKNNIIYNWDYGIKTVAANIGVVSNNLFHQVTSGREVTGTTDANKIVKDPLFVNTTIGNPQAFKPLPGSPALDAGTTSYASGGVYVTYRSPADAFGTTRYLGTAPDIGFYEGTGYTPNPTGEFDTLTTASTATTLTVKNSKWKIVFDKARGGGINFYSAMSDSATNLLASNSLLFDVKIDAYAASAQTANTIVPVFVERSRARAVVRQRLAVSSSLDLNVYYTLYASGQIYVQSEIANLSGATVAIGTLDYTLKVNNATTAYASAANASASGKNGFGYLLQATRGAALTVTQDLDAGASSAETWVSSATSGAGGTVVFNTADLVDPPKNYARHFDFLLYVGDASLDFTRSAALNADAYNPSPVALSAGSLFSERGWQEDGLQGHWTFDEGGGAAARDKSVYAANNAALSSTSNPVAYQWNSGKVNGGIALTAADVATVGTAAQLQACTGCTYMYWIKPDFSGMGNSGYIVSKGVSVSDGWYFRKLAGSNKIVFRMGADSVVSPTLTNQEWAHIAAVSNPSPKYLRLYVNGSLVAASTGTPTAVANGGSLLMGYNSGAAADKFQGQLDDVRLYSNALHVSRIQTVYHQGFSNYFGHYHLRADNNNRVVAVLNGTTAQTRVQPAFQIDNWFSGRSPKYVYLNGGRLTANRDFVVDSLGSQYNGSYLVLQLNKTLTGSNQTLFIDDDDSTGFMGTASAMKGLTVSATANDKIVIKNFADTVFGGAATGQWYLELDLNGWTNPNQSRTVDSGFGGFNVWKAAAVSPNLSISNAAQLVGMHNESGRSLLTGKLQNATNPNSIYFSGRGYAGPANISYTLVDSSATRISLTLATMTLSSSDGTVTVVKRYTVYPTGRIFASFLVNTTDFSMDTPRLDLNVRYNSGQTVTWSNTTAAANARVGYIDGDLDYHSAVMGLMSIRSAGSTVTTPAGMVASADQYSLNTGGADVKNTRLNMVTTLFESTDDPITVNFAVDISKDFRDSATADSLMKDIQTPAVITAITGTRITNDALDFNADNFAEGDGAYTYAASGGLAHFKYANTVTSFNPAFRISSWTYGTLPEVVILDNQTLTRGYHYNAYLNTTTSEVVIQFNKTLATGTHVIFISHKTGLAVTLNRFEAKNGDGVDTLEWTTESEFENLGYHVWRRAAPGAMQVDSAMAEAGEVAGAGIANALMHAAKSEVAAKAAAKLAKAQAGDTLGAEGLAGVNWTADELTAMGYVRITPRILPGAKGGSSASTQNYAYIDRTADAGVAYEYMLEAVDFNGGKVQYGPRTARPQNPLVTELYSNYPNPFNPITTLRFALKEKAKVSLVVYDGRGRVVRTLVRPEKPMQAGKYRLIWDAKNDGGFEVPSGQYFYRFTAGRYVKTRKMILVK